MRLIDADEALRLMSGWDWQELYLPAHFKEFVLDECKTIDAEPVRHGRWIENGNGNIICSQCLCIKLGGQSNYCPECGAKMDLIYLF